MKTLEERFWSKVERRGPHECWPWTAATNEHGYGVMRPSGQRSGPTVKAHRVSAELAGMDIAGLHVLHSCDNPICVNPGHLRPGDDAENMQDAKDRGRIPRGSQRPESRLTEDQVARIKELLALKQKHRVIAAEFGVTRATISMINTGKTWTHVCPPNARDLGMIAAESLGVAA